MLIISSTPFEVMVPPVMPSTLFSSWVLPLQDAEQG